MALITQAILKSYFQPYFSVIFAVILKPNNLYTLSLKINCRGNFGGVFLKVLFVFYDVFITLYFLQFLKLDFLFFYGIL